MKIKLIAALAAVVAALPFTAAAASAGQAAALSPVTYNYSFENSDWQGWVPEDGGNTRGWWIDHTNAQSHAGNTSLNFQLDGRWDNGTIWIERQFTAPVGTSVPVNITYWGWTPPQSDPTSVNVWPSTASIATVDHDLGYSHAPWPQDWDETPEAYSGGWHQYTLSKNVNTTASNGAVNIAIAIHANWESKRDYFHFDDVAVTIG